MAAVGRLGAVKNAALEQWPWSMSHHHEELDGEC
jgi:hypothetical protein